MNTSPNLTGTLTGRFPGDFPNDGKTYMGILPTHALHRRIQAPSPELQRIVDAQPTENEVFVGVGEDLAMSINALCVIVNDWAAKKGFNEDPIAGIDMPEEVRERIHLAFKNEQHMLMVTEIAEGVESMRRDKPGQPHMDDKVPELPGEIAELADNVIRVFHYCGQHGINLGEAIMLKHKFNITRPFKHGKNC